MQNELGLDEQSLSLLAQLETNRGNSKKGLTATDSKTDIPAMKLRQFRSHLAETRNTKIHIQARLYHILETGIDSRLRFESREDGLEVFVA